MVYIIWIFTFIGPLCMNIYIILKWKSKTMTKLSPDFRFLCRAHPIALSTNLAPFISRCNSPSDCGKAPDFVFDERGSLAPVTATYSFRDNTSQFPWHLLRKTNWYFKISYLRLNHYMKNREELTSLALVWWFSWLFSWKIPMSNKPKIFPSFQLICR